MPYKNPEKDRNYKKEYQLQKERARRSYDAKGVDRAGKDVSHKKMLSKGGSNSDGTYLESPSKNRARNGKSKGK